MSTDHRWHTRFSEVMAGEGTLADSPVRLPCHVDLDVEVPGLLHPGSDVHAALSGQVTLPGIAQGAEAEGTIHIAPLVRRRIRYQLDFTADDGSPLHLDGWKSVSYARPLRSMTTLPATVTDSSGTVVAEVLLRFSLTRHLLPMLRSVRIRRAQQGTDGATTGTGETDLRPRWNGERGRLEVWYTTLTDQETGTGFWLHHELVAPDDGAPARLHGWAAAFPPDSTPQLGRFGPEGWRDPSNGTIVDSDGATATPDRLTGAAGQLGWDLRVESAGPTLFTFPRWAWRTKLLPGAQVVPQPAARLSGTLRYADRTLHLDGAPGATAHIYGHGNAQRWAWLHADLGDGDVAEVVAAVSTRPGLRHLPPLPFVRLRVGGIDWPCRDPLLAALRLHARIGLPSWRVWGRVGDYWLHIEVTQPPEATVDVDYCDPDDSPAVCRNSERADARIVLQRRNGRWWKVVREWELNGTAHAEVGTRD
ncbi:hypothetical protein [Haloechinothrix sp. LS1_15]|uniref:hypothetical protein n=1 Tax=Haloechinothrix sp. LS1_15 TaxID=2652248 RepID=UPI002945B25D|nr:hypothetical protein [Haloechinothrix sp. LS1_15]MDV6014210.1 hypothetical protein [Haloechinothrix sp. LS1_15]